MKNNHHLRELKSIPFHEQNPPDEFREFAELVVLPSISITGYKRQAKRELAVNMLHSLVTTGLANKVVADSRDWHSPGAKLRSQIWDEVIGAGYATFCKGSEMSGKRSRYRATNKLLSVQYQWDLQMLQSHIPKDLVYMHTGKIDMATGRLLPPEDKKQPIPISKHVKKHAQPGPNGEPDPQAIINGLAYWREMERAINAINAENFNHGWKAHSPVKNVYFQPSVGLRQLHIGDAFNGARFYTWGRWEPRQSRKPFVAPSRSTGSLRQNSTTGA